MSKKDVESGPPQRVLGRARLQAGPLSPHSQTHSSVLLGPIRRGPPFDPKAAKTAKVSQPAADPSLRGPDYDHSNQQRSPRRRPPSRTATVGTAPRSSRRNSADPKKRRTLTRPSHAKKRRRRRSRLRRQVRLVSRRRRKRHTRWATVEGWRFSAASSPNQPRLAADERYFPKTGPIRVLHNFPPGPVTSDLAFHSRNV